MFLIDTNIFLEILLNQDKKDKCKNFLGNNIGNLNITDFSLHSIGIILFRYDKEDIFQEFIQDIIPYIKLLSLPINLYNELSKYRKNLKFDFDDIYQYCIAKHYGLKVVTMDNDFEKVKDIEIQFL